MSFSRFLTRTRSSTKVLLGDDYVEVASMEPVVPEPPHLLSAYNDQRLRQGLSFADQTLRQTQRKVSPITGHCLNIYKTTLKAVLEQDYDGEEEKEKLLAQVQTYEHNIYTRRLLKGPRDTAQATLVGRLTELRQYEFAARYGEYQAILCKKLKMHAQTFRTKNFEQLQGWNRYWTEIQEDLKAEKHLYEKFSLGDKKVDEDDVATTLAVYAACKNGGFCFATMLGSIEMYANRNKLLHAPIQEIASCGRWGALRTLLRQDRLDVPTAVPPSMTEQIPILQNIIDSCIDEFFDRSGVPALADDRWRIREEAERNAAQEEQNSEIRRKNIERSRQNIVATAAKASSKLIDDYKMAQLAVQGMGINLDNPIVLDTPTGSIPPDLKSLKRPRNEADRLERAERFKRQKKAWDTIISLQSQCQRRYKQYQDDYNTANPPIDPATWLDLAPTQDASPPSSSGSRSSQSRSSQSRSSGDQ